MHQAASTGADDATTSLGRLTRRFTPRLALIVATILWLLAWGRLGAVALTQPSPWQRSAWTLADGRTPANPRDYHCRLNAFQQDALVYRWCDDDNGRTFLVAFEPARRAATIRWELPSAFYGADWFEAFAVGPAGEVAIVTNRDSDVAVLRADGTTKALPQLRGPGVAYGFGWQGDRLGLVSAESSAATNAPTAPTVARLSVYEAGQGWSAPRPLPEPDCGADTTCALLVAAPTAQGWELHYSRAPLRSPDPDQISADILRVSPTGETRVVQTLPLSAAAGAYRVEEGQLRWLARVADRSGGNVLNYSVNPALRQLEDGTFQPLPTLPVDLFLAADERGAPLNPSQFPRGSSLTATYRIAAGRLIWQPGYSRGGDALDTARAVLLPDRWLVLRESDAGLALEERAPDAAATVLHSGPLVLGRQSALLNLSGYTSPLVQAPDGTHWLVGRFGDLVHIGPDLQRLDEHGPFARLGFLFSGFTGGYRDDFHTDYAPVKLAAIGLVLFAWPIMALLLALWWRRTHPTADDWHGWARGAALTYLIGAALAAPWYWLATAYL